MRALTVAILLKLSLSSCALYEIPPRESMRQQCAYTSIDQVFADAANAHGRVFCGDVFFRDVDGLDAFYDTLEDARDGWAERAILLSGEDGHSLNDENIDVWDGGIYHVRGTIDMNNYCYPPYAPDNVICVPIRHVIWLEYFTVKGVD